MPMRQRQEVQEVLRRLNGLFVGLCVGQMGRMEQIRQTGDMARAHGARCVYSIISTACWSSRMSDWRCAIIFSLFLTPVILKAPFAVHSEGEVGRGLRRHGALTLFCCLLCHWQQGFGCADRFGGEEAFAACILGQFRLEEWQGLLKVFDDTAHDGGAAEQAAGLEAALTGDELEFRGDDDGVDQADFGDALGELADIAKVSAIAIIYDDPVDVEFDKAGRLA